MKPRISHQRNRALTRTDVVVVIAILAVLFVLLLPALVPVHNGRQRIRCVNNLRQIGITYQLWARDNNDKFPMQVSVTNGGTMELANGRDAWINFLVTSNILSNPKLLICPQDTKSILATNFGPGFNNSNVSYFIGLDADQTNLRMLLSGDDNFAIGSVPVKSGLLELWTNTPIAWTKARHKFVGNILLADGSAQQLTTDDLQKALRQTGVATNRLAIP